MAAALFNQPASQRAAASHRALFSVQPLTASPIPKHCKRSVKHYVSAKDNIIIRQIKKQRASRDV